MDYSMYKFILVYLLLINLITFAIYGIDKSKAKRGKYRIRVSTLLGLAFVGGSVGALFGMQTFRHKTQKKMFTIGVPLMLIMHIGIIVFCLYKFWV